MARFYDCMNNSDLSRVTGLLKKGGIQYSLEILGKRPAIKEIQVAEEDITYAERLLSGAAQAKK